MSTAETLSDRSDEVVTLLVEDEIGRRVIAGHLSAVGIGVGDGPGNRLVADRIPPGGTVDVLIARPTRASLRRAVELFMADTAHSVVVADRPEHVAIALALLDDELCLLPAIAKREHLHWPSLDERDLQIWQAALAGQSNRLIATSLRLSEITVKRQVATLCRKLDVGSKMELCAAGLRYGLEPQALRR